jgi:hypothetical protein
LQQPSSKETKQRTGEDSDGGNTEKDDEGNADKKKRKKQAASRKKEDEVDSSSDSASESGRSKRKKKQKSWISHVTDNRNFKLGEEVLVRWKDDNLYKAIIQDIPNPHQFVVLFEDGSASKASR